MYETTERPTAPPHVARKTEPLKLEQPVSLIGARAAHLAMTADFQTDPPHAAIASYEGPEVVDAGELDRMAAELREVAGWLRQAVGGTAGRDAPPPSPPWNVDHIHIDPADFDVDSRRSHAGDVFVYDHGNVNFQDVCLDTDIDAVERFCQTVLEAIAWSRGHIEADNAEEAARQAESPPAATVAPPSPPDDAIGRRLFTEAIVDVLGRLSLSHLAALLQVVSRHAESDGEPEQAPEAESNAMGMPDDVVFHGDAATIEASAEGIRFVNDLTGDTIPLDEARELRDNLAAAIRWTEKRAG